MNFMPNPKKGPGRPRSPWRVEFAAAPLGAEITATTHNERERIRRGCWELDIPVTVCKTGPSEWKIIKVDKSIDQRNPNSEVIVRRKIHKAFTAIKLPTAPTTGSRRELRQAAIAGAQEPAPVTSGTFGNGQAAEQSKDWPTDPVTEGIVRAAVGSPDPVPAPEADNLPAGPEAPAPTPGPADPAPVTEEFIVDQDAFLRT